MIFADAFYWFALVNDKDAAHEEAVKFAAASRRLKITTEWVLAEVCDGLAGPRTRRQVIDLRTLWRNDKRLHVDAADHDSFERGLDLFCARPDKAWSLTDCISFEVMREHGVVEALTGDRHFEQAGFTPLLAG